MGIDLTAIHWSSLDCLEVVNGNAKIVWVPANEQLADALDHRNF